MAAPESEPASPGRLAISAAPWSRTSHTLTEVIVQSLVISWPPSGEKATERTPSRKSWAASRTTSCGAPASTAKTRAEPSSLPVASRLESGLQSTVLTPPVSPGVTNRRRPVRASNTCAPGLPLTAIQRPSGLHARSRAQSAGR